MIVDEVQGSAALDSNASEDDWDSVVGGDVTVIGDDHTNVVEREQEDDEMLAKAREVKEASPDLRTSMLKPVDKTSKSSRCYQPRTLP